MQQAKFGKMPGHERLQRIKNSSNYRDGKFQNLSFTPDLTEGVGYYKVMKEFLFDRNKRSTPVDTLPSKKIDLHSLNIDENVFVWFGHSSYFMQIDGKKILVDPVMSGHASPLKFTTKAFKGTDVYTTDDIPEIDYLFISHDHWDHLDYETIIKLKQQHLKIDQKQLNMAAGMQVVAEIRLADQTVMEYLLSPVRKAFHESARER